MSRKAPELLVALDTIESEMVAAGLWREERPSEEAFQSQLPFSVDTMAFEEWLQWVFVARCRDIIRCGYPLPDKSDVAPMAEESFAANGVDGAAVIAAIRHFDRLLSEK